MSARELRRVNIFVVVGIIIIWVWKRLVWEEDGWSRNRDLLICEGHPGHGINGTRAAGRGYEDLVAAIVIHIGWWTDVETGNAVRC